MAPPKHKIWTLEDKVQVLKRTDANVSSQIIAKGPDCGQTQVQSIIKDREKHHEGMERRRTGR